jgi:hypothetical protein
MIGSCRPRADARPHPHACSGHHAAVVESYREARASWEAQRDAACYGYAGDEALWTATHPAPTFRDWLRHMRSERQEGTVIAA